MHAEMIFILLAVLLLVYSSRHVDNTGRTLHQKYVVAIPTILGDFFGCNFYRHKEIIGETDTGNHAPVSIQMVSSHLQNQ